MLDKKSVVPEVRVYYVVLDIGYVLHENIVVRRREEYVGTDGDYERAGTYALQYILRMASSASQIM